MQSCLGTGAFTATRAWSVSIMTPNRKTYFWFLCHLKYLAALFVLPRIPVQHSPLKQGCCWEHGTCSPSDFDFFFFLSGKQTQYTEVRSLLAFCQSLPHKYPVSFCVWRKRLCSCIVVDRLHALSSCLDAPLEHSLWLLSKNHANPWGWQLSHLLQAFCLSDGTSPMQYFPDAALELAAHLERCLRNDGER